jgi:putative ABC transport system permease protein
VIASTFAEKVLPGTYFLPAAATGDFGLSEPVFGFVRLTGDDEVASVLPRVKALLTDSQQAGTFDSELVLPWAGMGTSLLLAAVVGVLAAVLPSIRAARLNVLAAIAHE